MKKLFTWLFIITMGSIGSVMAQNRTIKGKVIAKDDNQTIPGVSVMVKGSSVATVTDINGEFTLEVPATSSILVFSSVGMKTKEVEAGSSLSLNVILESDILKLDEVVVTANAIEREKRSLGYAVTSIGNEELTKGRDRSVLNSMQGKVPGVQITNGSGSVGSSTRVVIRGGTSFLGNNQPLYVIDGIPMDNASYESGDNLNRQVDAGSRVNDINPEDIESVTVLKGPAAAALYGSRASNGAIMITTKSGKTKRSSGKNAEMTFATGMTFETPLKLPEFQNDFGQGFFNEPDLRENTSWGAAFTGETLPYGNEVNGVQRTKPYSALPDNVKDFFDVGNTYTTDLSISGGGEKSTYYMSVGKVNQYGIMPGTEYNRTTFKVSGTSQLSNNFYSSASVYYVKSKGDLSIQGQNTATSPWENIIQTPRDISIIEQKNYNDTYNNLDNYYSPYTTNPYFALNENSYKNSVDHILGNVLLGYKANDWLDFSYRIGTDFYDDNREEINAVITYTPGSPNDLQGAATAPGRYEVTNITSREINSDLMLNAKKKLSENLNLNVLLGHNIREKRIVGQLATANALVIPGFYNLLNADGAVTAGNFLNLERQYGIYGSVDFAYKNYLFLGFTGRNDWSSTLPEKNNSFFYPSVNTSFVFSDAFNMTGKVFSFGKVFASYAKVGKAATPYVLTNTYEQPLITDGFANSQLNFPVQGVAGYTLGDVVSNPDLKPEYTRAYEFGIDLAFLNERVGIMLNYYDNLSDGQIFTAPFAASSGFGGKTINAGVFTNKGIETLLRLTPVESKSGFRWTIAFSYTKNKSMVEEIYPGLDQISLNTGQAPFSANPGNSFTGGAVVVQEGQPYGSLLVTAFERDPNGNVVVDPTTGFPIIGGDDIIAGTIQPDYLAGLTNNITYKNISFGFTFDIRQGGLMFSRTKSTMIFAGTDPITTYNDREPFVIPNSVVENPDGSYSPNTTPVGDALTYWAGFVSPTPNETLIDASYIKLREVSLTYQIPMRLIKDSPISGLSISLTGRNLWIKTHEDNHYVDPEASSFGNGNAQGFEYGTLPSVKSYGANIRLTF
ncbi:MAG: SusC/RagA family TonB-linked outer membrane protein [Bacteroidia bacterium]|nr:SusC/RagA family TonB-linked outer membrane protein [Bacteroidia bacterium]